MESEFLCPISWEWMDDPVELEDGTVYDRRSITDWFRRGKNTSPLTNEVLRSTSIVAKEDLWLRIKEWRLHKDPEFTGCRHLSCRYFGLAPEFLCSEHSGRMEPTMDFTEEDVIRILCIPADGIVDAEVVRVYEMFMRRLVMVENDTDFSFLDIHKSLRAADAKRLYLAAGGRSTNLQIYLVRRTLCPWLLDKDLFGVGLCYAGNFGEAPNRISQLERFVHRPIVVS